jgi:hypothetical protein
MILSNARGFCSCRLDSTSNGALTPLKQIVSTKNPRHASVMRKQRCGSRLTANHARNTKDLPRASPTKKEASDADVAIPLIDDEALGVVPCLMQRQGLAVEEVPERGVVNRMLKSKSWKQ